MRAVDPVELVPVHRTEPAPGRDLVQCGEHGNDEVGVVVNRTPDVAEHRLDAVRQAPPAPPGPGSPRYPPWARLPRRSAMSSRAKNLSTASADSGATPPAL